MEENARDKAGKEYWDSIWEDLALTEIANPELGGIKNVTIRIMSKHLEKSVADLINKPIELLEVGCGNSVWLPYFAKKFGFNVTGLDYSELGCEHERRVLKAAGINGEVICSDFFAPPDEMIGKYDVVTSFGVVEHFVPTEGCLEAFARFLKPKGRIITEIPNVQGINGLLMKTTNRPFYDKHVSLSSKTLAEAHEKAGFKIIDCQYIFTTNFYVPNTSGLDPNLTSTKIKETVLRNLGRGSLLALALGEKVNFELKSGLISPYILCVAEKN